jgi:hypothetical protein
LFEVIFLRIIFVSNPVNNGFIISISGYIYIQIYGRIKSLVDGARKKKILLEDGRENIHNPYRKKEKNIYTHPRMTAERKKI